MTMSSLQQVVQVYIQWVDHDEVAPQVQLVAFERVSLKLGEKQSVTMELTDERMALWANDEDGFQVLPGRQIIRLTLFIVIGELLVQ